MNFPDTDKADPTEAISVHSNPFFAINVPPRTALPLQLHEEAIITFPAKHAVEKMLRLRPALRFVAVEIESPDLRLDKTDIEDPQLILLPQLSVPAKFNLLLPETDEPNMQGP